MKITFLDVEVAPNLATVWGVYNQNIGINQLLETSRIMCYTYQHYKEKHAFFGSEYEMGHKQMIESLWDVLNDTDVVCHYNGIKFDIPVINREFLKYDMSPPSPYKQIDLYKVIKKEFRFVSNKLDHICRELDIGAKAETGGHELWLACMQGDVSAWKRMEEYNIRDVSLVYDLYDKLKPWIKNHPNLALYLPEGEEPVCPNCGSKHLQRRGVEHTNTQSYRRYQCMDCKTWSRSRFTLRPSDTTVLTQVKT